MSELADRMTTTVARQADPTKTTLRDELERLKPQLARALPAHLDAERFLRIVLTEMRRNPKLGTCTPASFLGAVMVCAQLGLEPDPRGLAYLIPRWSSKVGANEVTFMIGYRGYIDLARRSGQTVSIDAQIVYAGDTFDFEYGTDSRLRHVPALEGRGGARCAYAVARFKDGGHSFVVLPLEEIDKRRGRSQAKDDGPWKTDWDAMARKTAVRALAPYLPQTVELANAQRVDDAVISDIAVDLDELPTPPRDDEEIEPAEPVVVSDEAGEAGSGDAPSGSSETVSSGFSSPAASDDFSGTPYGYELWSREWLEAECKGRTPALPTSGNKERLVNELRAWDALRGCPYPDGEPDVRPLA